MARKQGDTSIDVEKRRAKVCSMIANSIPSVDIVEWLMEEHNFTYNTAHNELTIVRKLFAENGKEYLKEQIEHEISRLEEQVAQAELRDDQRSKVEYIKLIHKLKGLDKQKVELSGEVSLPVINIILNKKDNG